jgi:hypothetical protein
MPLPQKKKSSSLEAGHGAQRHSLDNEVDRLFSFRSPTLKKGDRGILKSTSLESGCQNDSQGEGGR